MANSCRLRWQDVCEVCGQKDQTQRVTSAESYKSKKTRRSKHRQVTMQQAHLLLSRGSQFHKAALKQRFTIDAAHRIGGGARKRASGPEVNATLDQTALWADVSFERVTQKPLAAIAAASAALKNCAAIAGCAVDPTLVVSPAALAASCGTGHSPPNDLLIFICCGPRSTASRPHIVSR